MEDQVAALRDRLDERWGELVKLREENAQLREQCARYRSRAQYLEVNFDALAASAIKALTDIREGIRSSSPFLGDVGEEGQESLAD